MVPYISFVIGVRFSSCRYAGLRTPSSMTALYAATQHREIRQSGGDHRQVLREMTIRGRHSYGGQLRLRSHGSRGEIALRA
jgi:hypothetical protein